MEHTALAGRERGRRHLGMKQIRRLRSVPCADKLTNSLDDHDKIPPRSNTNNLIGTIA